MLLIAVTAAGGAKAVTDTTFRYATPKTGQLQIPPAAFVAEDSTASDYTYGTFGTYLEMTTGTGCYVAPVNLPDGAKLTQLTFWYVHQTLSAYFVHIIRQTMADGTYVHDAIFKSAAGSASADRRAASVTINNAAVQTVSNAKYSYTMRVCMTVGDRFYGGRLTYTYDNAGE